MGQRSRGPIIPIQVPLACVERAGGGSAIGATGVTITSPVVTGRRRAVVVLCIAVIALSAFLPGAGALEYVGFEPSWILLPDSSVVAIDVARVAHDEQPLALFSLLPSRAPPSVPLT